MFRSLERKGIGMATILIAEDDLISRKLLVSIIANMGHAVVPTVNGRMALDILLNHGDIDLVVTDVMMPEMDGIELVQQIRKLDSIKTLPIIVISAYIGVNAANEVLEKGASAFMVKPIEAQALKQYITKYLPSS